MKIVFSTIEFFSADVTFISKGTWNVSVSQQIWMSARTFGSMWSGAGVCWSADGRAVMVI